jgi:hypothetical protein
MGAIYHGGIGLETSLRVQTYGKVGLANEQHRSLFCSATVLGQCAV